MTINKLVGLLNQKKTWKQIVLFIFTFLWKVDGMLMMDENNERWHSQMSIFLQVQTPTSIIINIITTN